MTKVSPVSRFVQRCARGAGVYISSYPPHGTLQRHLRDYFAQMEINIVLDVGAFIGTYAAGLREMGYKGRIISFEPVPASFERLQERMRGDAQWSGQQFGLSDESREAVMNTYAAPDLNSLLALRDQAEQAYHVDSSQRGQTSIQLRRLDELFSQLTEGIAAPRVFMKIDTQGHDVSVVKGATAVLEKIIGLQSELPAVQIYDGMPSMAEALSYYASCGYVPIGFYPVNTFRDIQVSPEFDVLLNRFDGQLRGSM